MKISTLRLIVSTLQRSNYAFDDIFQSKHRRATRLIRLYQGIKTNVITSDKEAANFVYGDSVPASRLTELKNRLYSALINCIATLSPQNSNSTELQRRYLDCINQYYSAHLMSNISYSGTIKAIILDKALRQAKKYEFTELVYLLLTEIIQLVGKSWINAQLYDSYNSQITQYRHILDAERTARAAYNFLLEHYSAKQTTFPVKELSTISKKKDLHFAQYEDVTSHRFLLNKYFYFILKSEITGNLHDALKVCEQAIDELRKKPFSTELARSRIALRVIAICIKLKDFDRAEVELENSYIRSMSTTESTRAINLYTFILKAHQRDYQSAFEIAIRATQSKSIKSRSPSIQELWRILDAYAHFFAHTGLAGLSDTERSKLNRFRIYKFLNDVPVFSKDKRGMNITILILHVLFLLWTGKLADASDRITALKAYSRKYLIHDETYRSNCFIKMLVELDKGDFHPIRGQRYAQKYCDKLAEVPLSKSLQGIEVEIVPYEHLWEMVIDLCHRHLQK